VTKFSLAALDGVPDGAQQHLVAKWLGQELDNSRLHGLRPVMFPAYTPRKLMGSGNFVQRDYRAD
jgi:hypothetical protein